MASRARKRIEQAALQQGYTVYSATYEPIQMLEMGDALGGWVVKLSGVDDSGLTMVGAANVDGVIGEIMTLPLRRSA